ncbi:MAG: HAD family phosphatase [Luteolibacter sp.]
MPLAAVIFDFDGVVIDSHQAHERSWFILADEIGQTLTSEQFTATFGQRNETILPLLGWAEERDAARITELGDRKEAIYREILANEGIEALPGVVALLEDLKREGIPTAVGTSAQRKNIECVFKLLGIGHLFQDVAASEDVTRGKPDPEVFLKAAAKLGANPADCVVIEDAHAGLRAARAGGMKCIGVTTTHSAESLAAETPDGIVETLEMLDTVAFRALW